MEEERSILVIMENSSLRLSHSKTQQVPFKLAGNQFDSSQSKMILNPSYLLTF